LNTFSAKPILFIVSGPSGSGKRTLIQHIVNRLPEIERVPTYTTRSPRSGEIPNVDYVFVTTEEFSQLLKSGEIYEYTRTYGDQLYGSPRRLLEDHDGRDLIVELDYKGMFRIRASTSRRVVSIFILPPVLDVLPRRIEKRTREHNITNRLAIASEQLQFAWAYDYVLMNEKMDYFLQDATCIVKTELLKKKGIKQLLEYRHHYDFTLLDQAKIDISS
jgi:guanylate kinase